MSASGDAGPCTPATKIGMGDKRLPRRPQRGVAHADAVSPDRQRRATVSQATALLSYPGDIIENARVRRGGTTVL